LSEVLISALRLPAESPKPTSDSRLLDVIIAHCRCNMQYYVRQRM